MNIFAYETKAQVKSFVVWAVSLLGLFILFGAAFFSMFMKSKSAVQDALASLPPAFSAVFGVQVDTIFTYGGFYQFIYTYVALVGAIMASSFGLGTFAREKRSKCVDFLFTKPVSRGRIFIAKLLACLALIVAVNALYMAASVISYLGNGQDASHLGELILETLSLLFMQLVFLAISILYATLAKKVRSVSGVATAIGFAGFILMALNSLVKEEALRYISPLTYLSPGDVFVSGGYEAKYALTGAVVFIACIAASYVIYRGSDTPSI